MDDAGGLSRGPSSGQPLTSRLPSVLTNGSVLPTYGNFRACSYNCDAEVCRGSRDELSEGLLALDDGLDSLSEMPRLASRKLGTLGNERLVSEVFARACEVSRIDVWWQGEGGARERGSGED